MSATNKRITELTSASAIASDDYMAIDSVARGTKKYKVSEILDMIDDDFDTVVSEMQFSNPPDVYPYNKGDIVWRDDNGTKKIYVAKNDYPSGVTEYDSGEWDEYDTLAEVIKADVPVASEISYDNTTSGLTATDVQDAIDEVSGDIPTTLAELGDDDTHRTVTDTEKATWSGKQDALTFDNVPTEDSNNPVKSGGIFDEFADKQAQIYINTMIGTVPNLPSPIATFTDGANLPMPKLKIAVEPVQEGRGDPSPTNIRPISGWTEANVSVSGVNVWDEEVESGDYNPNTGEKRSDSARFRSKNPIMCFANTNYYFRHPSNADNAYIIFFDANNNFISSKYCAKGGTGPSSPIFTTPANAKSFGFFVWASSAITYNNDISINYPSTDTEYHAYNGHTYTIDLDGTRYGGKLDVVSGVLTVENAEVDLGDLTWTAQTDSQGTYFRSDKPNGMKLVPQGAIPNALCSIYPITTSINVYDGSIAFSVGSEGYIFVRDTRFTDATDFKTAMNGVQLVYELATPLTIQLTPTAVKSLQGLNNVFADTGDVVEASYVRDATLTINDILARIEALENA